MQHRLSALVIALALTIVPAAAQDASPIANVAGTWNMGLQGDHVIPVALVIEQDGAEVKATFTIMEREIPFAGLLAGRELTLESTVKVAMAGHGAAPGEPSTMTFVATLKADGTLDGLLSGGGRPSIKVSGERLRQRPPRTSKPPAPGTATSPIAGRWNAAVAMGEQRMALALVLHVDGDKVTGTLTGDHAGEQRIEGTYAGGTLQFRSVAGGSAALTYEAALKPDGTLAGRITAPGGAYNWTAERVKP